MTEQIYLKVILSLAFNLTDNKSPIFTRSASSGSAPEKFWLIKQLFGGQSY